MNKKMYPTPHIDASPEDFAKTVLMPGDPLRSKFVAENFLSDAVLINNVRGVMGYTGKYKGHDVTVMASGMGIPSIGIYSYELYNFFGVENIIRIGSAGALQKDIKIKDIVFGMGACTNSNYASQFGITGNIAPICSYFLLKNAVNAAKNKNVNYHIGNLFSSDTFYNDDAKANEGYIKMGALAVEMEAAGLYLNAMRSGKNALAICTISDHIVTGETTTAIERQNSFTDMIEIALETTASV